MARNDLFEAIRRFNARDRVIAADREQVHQVLLAELLQGVVERDARIVSQRGL